jgi:hypothetical protein
VLFIKNACQTTQTVATSGASLLPIVAVAHPSLLPVVVTRYHHHCPLLLLLL